MVTVYMIARSPRRPLEGNPALLMVLVHLGTPGGGSEKGAFSYKTQTIATEGN